MSLNGKLSDSMRAMQLVSTVLGCVLTTSEKVKKRPKAGKKKRKHAALW